MGLFQKTTLFLNSFSCPFFSQAAMPFIAQAWPWSNRASLMPPCMLIWFVVGCNICEKILLLTVQAAMQIFQTIWMSLSFKFFTTKPVQQNWQIPTSSLLENFFFNASSIRSTDHMPPLLSNTCNDLAWHKATTNSKVMPTNVKIMSNQTPWPSTMASILRTTPWFFLRASSISKYSAVVAGLLEDDAASFSASSAGGFGSGTKTNLSWHQQS